MIGPTAPESHQSQGIVDPHRVLVPLIIASQVNRVWKPKSDAQMRTLRQIMIAVDTRARVRRMPKAPMEHNPTLCVCYGGSSVLLQNRMAFSFSLVVFLVFFASFNDGIVGSFTESFHEEIDVLDDAM